VNLFAVFVCNNGSRGGPGVCTKYDAVLEDDARDGRACLFGPFRIETLPARSRVMASGRLQAQFRPGQQVCPAMAGSAQMGLPWRQTHQSAAARLRLQKSVALAQIEVETPDWSIRRHLFSPSEAPARGVEPVRALTARASTFRGPASVEKLAASAAVEPREVAPRRPPILDRFQRSYAASIHSVRGGSCCLHPPPPLAPPPTHHPARRIPLARCSKTPGTCVGRGQVWKERGPNWATLAVSVQNPLALDPAETPHNGRPCGVVATAYGHDADAYVAKFFMER